MRSPRDFTPLDQSHCAASEPTLPKRQNAYRPTSVTTRLRIRIARHSKPTPPAQTDEGRGTGDAEPSNAKDRLPVPLAVGSRLTLILSSPVRINVCPASSVPVSEPVSVRVAEVL